MAQRDESQIIFLDAPGVHPSKIAIDEAMEESVSKVLEDADIVVCLIDPTRVPGEEDGLAAGLAASCGKPVLLVLNKSDVSTPAQRSASLAFYRERLPDSESLEMSALDGASAGRLIARLKSMLPEEFMLYDREGVTTAYERDIAAELIRESILELMRSVYENYAVADMETSNGLVLHSTYSNHSPYNTCNHYGVDECNSWGDYFYMEALTRLLKDWREYW